jgi:hypothetical protein
VGIYYPYCVAELTIHFEQFTSEFTSPRFPGVTLSTPREEPTIFSVIPRSATVLYNGYRQADTFTLEFDARELPITPEAIRTASVRICMFTADRLLTHDEINKRAQTERIKANTAEAPPVWFVGISDDASIAFSSDGGTIHLTGKDYTAFFTARSWPPNRGVESGKDLKETLQKLADDVIKPSTEKDRGRITVEYFGEQQAIQTGSVGKNVTQRKTTVKAAKTTGFYHRAATKKHFPVPSGRNYWDVMYDLCLAHGTICYVDGTTIQIAEPHTLSESAAEKAATFSYGQNLRSLSIERHLLKSAVPQIVASAYDPKQGRKVEGKWPRQKNVKPATSPNKKDLQHAAERIGGQNSLTREQMRVRPPKSIVTQQGLEEYCRAYYESIARNEAQVRFETVELKSLNKIDLLTLRAGQAVFVNYTGYDPVEFSKLTAVQRYEKLLSLGYREAVANVLASSFTSVEKYRVPLYIKSVTFNWSATEGIGIQCEAVNFIVPKREEGA